MCSICANCDAGVVFGFAAYARSRDADNPAALEENTPRGEILNDHHACRLGRIAQNAVGLGARTSQRLSGPAEGASVMGNDGFTRERRRPSLEQLGEQT